jgi:putative SOS response-associated peptidase YedK
MCGRYFIAIEDEYDDEDLKRIIDEINRRHPDSAEAMHRGEIRPTDAAPVLAADVPQPMRWGFILGQDARLGINARRETAAQKPSFARPLRERRLAVPTSGFFEWSHEGGKVKDKYLFRLPNAPVLYLAGMWDLFALPNGRTERRFTILTTEANAGMRRYHDRMPVYLMRAELRRWLSDETSVPQILNRAQPELAASPFGPLAPEQLSMI